MTSYLERVRVSDQAKIDGIHKRGHKAPFLFLKLLLLGLLSIPRKTVLHPSAQLF